jgi:hypothetical protein
MLEMPIIEPPGGVWAASWRAPAWMVWKAPVRLVVRVEDQRDGVMLVWGVRVDRDVEECHGGGDVGAGLLLRTRGTL